MLRKRNKEKKNNQKKTNATRVYKIMIFWGESQDQQRQKFVKTTILVKRMIVFFFS